jgi:porphobilinogen deaminase
MHFKQVTERMLSIKWTDRITKDEAFQTAKEERLLFKTLQNRCYSLIGHTIRHNEFVVNILAGAIYGKKAVGKSGPRILIYNTNSSPSLL